MTQAATRALAAAYAVLVLTTFTSCSTDSSSGDGGGDTDEGDGFGAEVMCEEFVKQRLKSPGSAVFSDQQHTDRGASTWDVTGVVDSWDYSCTMKYLGDDEWKARDVALAPR